jgi:hypothetical protein
MPMRFQLVRAAALAALLAGGSAAAAGPVYTPDGKLLPPADYREWIFLTSSLDMSYRSNSDPDMHMFSNIFVQPEAYRAFHADGTWPEGTTLVMEMRGARNAGSINKRGRFQTTEAMGLELHVKDSARFKDGWGFFGSDDGAPAAMIPAQAECYSCHREHGAVDTTFVQFYPTLLKVAEKKRTLTPAFVKENEAAAEPVK